MWLARKHTRAALSEIGHFFGRRSHSTVISAQKRVDGWMASGASLRVAENSWGVDDAIRKVEQHLRGSGLAWTMLRAGFFAQNVADAYRQDIVEDDRIVLPAGDGAASWVDVRDVAELAARALVHGELRGEAPSLVGPERLDFHQVAALLSELLGRPIRYQPVSVPGFLLHCRRRDEPLGFAMVKAMLHFTLRFGNSDAVDPSLERLLARRPGDLRSYLTEHLELFEKG